ncbi:MAG: RHS repeat-associated core domain-containing protein, partial [Spirochaetia bacterium]|nr:RHS repeat-associated core domain-containing protein [Spirochaetia bacterium]
DVSYHKITQEAENVYSTDYGWGLLKEDNSSSEIKGSRYCRAYIWNERNQLISSVDSNYSTAYVYGQDGQRSNKYTQNSETLYFNKMWTLHTDSGNNVYGGQSAKNIYLGETRIVTKLNSGEDPTYQEEYYKQYFYHSDHLGSASFISDYKGDEYQRIEYTPYGEAWVEKTSNTGLEYLPYKFTAKELDEETGLYYYGARYLDPKYSMWISTDPALGEYIPQAPVNEETKQHNQNLPGLGGVFNTVNLNLYHYAANNPIKYTDPDGRSDIYKRKMDSRSNIILGVGNFFGFRHYLFRGKFFKGNGRYSIYQFSQGGVSQYESSYFKNFEYEIVYSDLDEDIAEQAAQNVKNSVDPKTRKKLFSKETYKIFDNDCHDFTDAIMSEYERLWKEKNQSKHENDELYDVDKEWNLHQKKITKRKGEIVKFSDINCDKLEEK